MRQQIASILLTDRALSTGLLGGILISVMGLSGYIAVPYLTGEERYLMYAAMGAGFDMPGYPLWYHGLVLVLPSFVASLGGTLLIHRWRLTGSIPTLKLIGCLVGVPLIAIVLAYLVTAGIFGLLVGVSMAEENPFMATFGVFVFAGYALIFGVIAVVFAMAIVFVSVSLGTVGGFLLAHGLVRFRDIRNVDA